MKKYTNNLDDWRSDPHNSFGTGSYSINQNTRRASEVVRDDERPPLIVGLEWSARIVTVGLEFALPTLGGWWLDRQWGTQWLWIAGSALGLVVGGMHLIQLAVALSREAEKRSSDEDR